MFEEWVDIVGEPASRSKRFVITVPIILGVLGVATFATGVTTAMNTMEVRDIKAKKISLTNAIKNLANDVEQTADDTANTLDAESTLSA